METKTGRGANVIRWVLLLFNALLLIGMFAFVVSEPYWDIYTWDFFVKIPRIEIEFEYLFYWGTIFGVGNNGAIVEICMKIFPRVLIIVPLLHTLKLFGVFGERMRNSAVVSAILSLLELFGVVVIPACYVFLAMKPDHIPAQKSFQEALQSITVYAYVVAAVMLVIVILSIFLRKTKPVFGEDYEMVKRGGTIWHCPSCGIINTPRDMRCRSCGAFRPKGK